MAQRFKRLPTVQGSISVFNPENRTENIIEMFKMSNFEGKNKSKENIAISYLKKAETFSEFMKNKNTQVQEAQYAQIKQIQLNTYFGML